MECMIVEPSNFSRVVSTLFDEWKTDLQEFLRSKLPQLVVIAIVAFVLIRLLRLITGRMVYVAERHAAGALRVSQVKTLASVIRATGIAAIGLVSALMALDTMDIKLSPLLASAGIAGVAIGLAAQTLVKDMLNGIFILMEDQFTMGDVVRVAGVSGKVESMSLRKTLIRDSDGTLYVVPNSQITTVANQSRDYSVATINVSIDYSADPDKVMALLQETVMGVRTDPTYADVFLDDPKILGVDALKGSEVIYPVVLKTKANQHWDALRETKRRIRLALEENHMLPGDPNRVFLNWTLDRVTGRSRENHTHESTDPTTIKPIDMNPFTGDGV
jgi:moderate conductance mechanosensitive channel